MSQKINFGVRDLVVPEDLQVTTPPFRPLVILCPACNRSHVDRGRWALIIHRKHLCEFCGNLWRPKTYPTIGVDPGMSLLDEWFGAVGEVYGIAVVRLVTVAWKNREDPVGVL